jgi:hypothetical protein
MEKTNKCPHCSQFIIDEIISVDFPSLDKKPCLCCGKKILKEAKICRFCHKWLDEINRTADGVNLDNLYED